MGVVLVFDDRARLHWNDSAYGGFALRLRYCSDESILTSTETESSILGGEAESELQGFGRDGDNGVGSRRLKGKGDVDIRIDT
ncbi:hypothetical protein MTR_7g057100 [Medicago truncatula]|uniref:Uncharacterized protein n=1 Tax=Medicago truncatula TaxID=3880 RepID=G7L168_MEDTR|nr:hypothetical protein MTR_7g057100 [Medicago truncatula]